MTDNEPQDSGENYRVETSGVPRGARVGSAFAVSAGMVVMNILGQNHFTIFFAFLGEFYKGLDFFLTPLLLRTVR